MTSPLTSAPAIAPPPAETPSTPVQPGSQPEPRHQLTGPPRLLLRLYQALPPDIIIPILSVGPMVVRIGECASLELAARRIFDTYQQPLAPPSDSSLIRMAACDADLPADGPPLFEIEWHRIHHHTDVDLYAAIERLRRFESSYCLDLAAQ